LTGGEEGVLAASLSNKGFDATRKDIELLRHIAERIYVELQRHCDVVEERRNQAAVRLGETLACRFSTNGVRYATAVEREFWMCSLHPESLQTRNGRGCLNETTNAISVRQRDGAAIFRSAEAIRTLANSPQDSNIPWHDLGYEFRAIPFPRETMDSFFASALKEGFQTGMALNGTMICLNAPSARWSAIGADRKLHLAGTS